MKWVFSLLILVVVSTSAPVASAKEYAPDRRCQSSQLSASGRFWRSMLGASARSVREPIARVEAQSEKKTARAEIRFEDTWDRAAKKASRREHSCYCDDEGFDVLDDMHEQSTDIERVLDGSTGENRDDNRMRAAILSAAGKCLKRAFAAESRNARKPAPDDRDDARERIRGQFLAAAEKAIRMGESRGATYDGLDLPKVADAIDALVDDCRGRVMDLVTELSGKLPLPVEAEGSTWAVYFDDDLDPANGYAAMGTGTAGPGLKLEWVVAGVPEGSYHLYAFVWAESGGGPGDEVEDGDYHWIYSGTILHPPTGRMIGVPSCGSIEYGYTTWDPMQVVGDGPLLSDLEGSWSGAIRFPNGSLHTISLVLEDDGYFTNHKVDGERTYSYGHVTRNGPWDFTFTDSDDSHGRMLLDATGTHLGFFDDQRYFGVMEKGADGLPSYAEGDLEGEWRGPGVRVDADMAIDSVSQMELSVTSGMAVTGLLGDQDLLGQIDDLDETHGVYEGSFDAGSMGEGDWWLYLSADRSFVAILMETKTGSLDWPEDYEMHIGIRR